MALIVNDRVKETSTTTGTTAFALGTAVTGFETFAVGIGNSNTTYYCIALQDGAEFEVGLGTLNSDSTTLTRTTIISSSNSDSAVDFSAGTKDVFCTLPASKAVIKDASDNTNFADNEKIQLGIGNDLKIYHDGSNSFIDQTGGTGEIVLKAASSRSTLLTNSSSQNIIAAGSTAAYLYNSGSVKLETTTTGVDVTGVITTDGLTTSADINFGDDDKAVFGAGTDLEIFHDTSGGGTDNIIQTPNVSHSLKVKSDSIIFTGRSGSSLASFSNGGTATLSYSGSAKLSTTNTGIQTTGTVNVNGAYTLPTSDGTANQILETDGSGAVTFVDKPTEGASAGFVIAMSVAL